MSGKKGSHGGNGVFSREVRISVSDNANEIYSQNRGQNLTGQFVTGLCLGTYMYGTYAGVNQGSTPQQMY